mgnify:CR=1 FL=1
MSVVGQFQVKTAVFPREVAKPHGDLLGNIPALLFHRVRLTEVCEPGIGGIIDPRINDLLARNGLQVCGGLHECVGIESNVVRHRQHYNLRCRGVPEL